MGETRQAPGKALARAQGPGLSASRTGSCWHPGWGQGRSPAYTHSCLTPAGAVLLGGGGSGEPAAGKWSRLDQPKPEATQDRLRGWRISRAQSCSWLRHGSRQTGTLR